MASEDDGANPSISNIADTGDGKYEVTLRCAHGCDTQGLTGQLKSGKLKWKELSCESTADSLRLEMIKQMAPPPRVQFVLEIGEDPEEPAEPETSSLYFQSYGDVEVHELMLRDRPRMEAYHTAIQNLKHLIVGKAVLDVGTGTGVLAMMAAKVGARVVYAVEASSTAHLARKLVDANNFSDTVKVIHGKMEDVELPEQVDVIVSEWMGFYLLHESMLGSVLFARDRWLVPGGLMLPGRATIHACPVSWERGRAEHVTFWEDCYGLDLGLLGEQKLAGMAGKPLVEDVAADDLLCEPAELCDLDLHSVTAADLVCVERSFGFRCSKPAAQLAGVALWFDCHFTPRDAGADSGPAALGKRARDAENGQHAVVLSTSPKAEATHWKQTTILFGGFFEVAEGEELPMTLRLEQDPQNPRTYALTVQT